MSNAPRIDGIEEVTQDLQEVLGVTTEATLIPQYMTATTATGAPASGTFYSAISGRAPMLDPRKIPTGRFGVERIMFLGNNPVITGEVGSSGETVYDSPDSLGRIRSVGQWGFEGSGSNGPGDWGTSTLGSSIEITFYGTALNMVAFQNPFNRTYDVFVDGVAAPGMSVTGSVVISDEDYGPHIIYSVVSGLTLGVHTVTIVDTSGNGRLYGFEILNESTDVQIPEGSITSGTKKIDVLSQTDDLTTFENEYQDGSTTITDATKGGHIVRYITEAGVIAKDINYADSTQLNLTSTDHSNEEVVQKFNWREFGAGRSDDFSTLDTSVGVDDRVFTLDDGITTLVGDDVYIAPVGTDVDGLTVSASGDSITLTFVGTGLDVTLATGAGATSEFNVYVDGSDVGNLSTVAADTEAKVFSIVSGLPFGTHTAKFEFGATNTINHVFYDFIVYGPKKPTIPTGAVEIDSTYKMADFAGILSVANQVEGTLKVPNGTVRKQNRREWTYVGGGWTNSLTVHTLGGYRVSTNDATDYAEYTFFGTGFDVRITAGTGGGGQSTLTLYDHDTATTITDFTPYTTNDYYITFTPGTGNIDRNPGGSIIEGGVTVSDLPLKIYTLRLTNDSAASGMYPAAVDIITPTYNYSNNVLNTSDRLVGSNSLKNEVLIPGATKTKAIFTEGVDLGPNKTKWQMKPLTSDYVLTPAATEIPYIRFSGLTPGKTYKLTTRFMGTETASVANETQIGAYHSDGTFIGVCFLWRDQSIGGNARAGDARTMLFVAKSDGIYFTGNSQDSMQIFGNASGNNSMVILEELPNHIETNEW
jgi:hypothetical protein